MPKSPCFTLSLKSRQLNTNLLFERCYVVLSISHMITLSLPLYGKLVLGIISVSYTSQNVDILIFLKLVKYCLGGMLAQNPHSWVRPSPGGVRSLHVVVRFHNASMCNSNHSVGMNMKHTTFHLNVTRSRVLRNASFPHGYCNQIMQQPST